MEEHPSVPRKRTRQPPDVRRASILDAAVGLFTERGVDASTMADVAEAAGVAKGTVYLYFDSREDLLAALQARYAEDLIAEARTLLPVGGHGSRIRRLDAFIVGLAESYQRDHRLYHVLFEAPGASEAAILSAIRELLRRFVEDGVAAGEFDVPDVDLATEFLLQGVHASLSRALHEGDLASRVPAIQRLARRSLGL
jgi:TetR/AcrR family transcriptional repressor of nem operon